MRTERGVHAVARTTKPWARVVILIGAVFALGLLAQLLTGSVLPRRTGDALIFQNALLLIVLGSALLEHKFTKPADSVVNALMGAITLLTVYAEAPRLAWWCVFAYCLAVFLVSTVCTGVSSARDLTGWQSRVARWTYRPAVLLGGARRLYSVVFLFAVFSFYETHSVQAVVLVAFWGVFVTLWPLGVPELLSMLTLRKRALQPVGRVVRTDSPNLVRCALRANAPWSRNHPMIYCQADGEQKHVLPLYSQVQEDGLLGTGLCVGALDEAVSGLDHGFVYEWPGGAPTPGPTAAEGEGSAAATSTLVGFVVEDSEIGQVRFETWETGACREGMLVWCHVCGEKVYYQVTNGINREEALETDRHGFQIAVAQQLGILSGKAGFVNHEWLPSMNTPVFAEPLDFGSDTCMGEESDFEYGTIPRSGIRVKGDFAGAFDHHMAILGVTGCGKTELAFDLIRHAVERGIKVLCIDLTSRYEGRLTDLSPHDLSIEAVLASDLSDKLFDVETGQYGAGKEKKVLGEFVDELRSDVAGRLEQFLTSDESADRVGIIRLEEISNTRATLYITELYLTCLLRFARDHADRCPRTLIVVEEAHTVMPEPSTMGLGDYDARGLVGKIAQIALQGRKYHVGLLVIAQRTATVSKSVLTQCNSIVSFACFDDTSLGFLRNVFGPAHVALIPNLPPLQAVVVGRAVRSRKPVIIAIPYDPSKAGRRQ